MLAENDADGALAPDGSFKQEEDHAAVAGMGLPIFYYVQLVNNKILARLKPYLENFTHRRPGGGGGGQQELHES